MTDEEIQAIEIKVLKAERDQLRAERDAAVAENTRLRQFASRQTSEIESLHDMADAVERLREIGRATGCDHVDGPDGRAQLVNCVEQVIAKAEIDRDEALAQLRSAREAQAKVAEVLKERLAKIVCADGCDRGVVLLSCDGPTHYDAEAKCQVYDHENFSPLGDALIELWDILNGKDGA